MLYRPFGNAGKMVSALGFGGMRFGEDEAEAHAALERALELGVTYFDTAPGYCGDRSELLLGEVFAHHDPATFFVSTKSPEWHDKTADAVISRCQASLKNLCIPRITFYNMWCIQDWDQFERVMAPGGPYEGAVKLKQDGLIEHICFSTHCDGPTIARIIERGVFEGMTLGYHLANFRYRQQGLQAGHDAGLGVVTMNPLGGGLLARDHFAFMREDGFSPVQSALRFNLSHPQIAVTLSGMATVAQVEENCAAVENLREPSAALVDSVVARYESLGENFCTDCHYCEPECPQAIPISRYMRFRDSVTLDGLTDHIRDRVRKQRDEGKLKGGLPEACTACGACEVRCTQHLPIIKRLEKCQEDLGEFYRA